MAVEWLLKGEYVKNCNCAPGCPCYFGAAPTHHFCAGMFAMRIREGFFGATRLDNLIIAGTYHWPGPLHQGQGIFQPYIDQKSTAAQRYALLTIMAGKVGNAWFEVLASVVSVFLDPQYVPIEFQFDLDKRSAFVRVANEFEAITEPIRSIATGDAHRVLVELPNGMEYFRPEIATTRVLKSDGVIKFDCPGAHSSMAVVEHRQTGLVRG